MSGQVLIYIRKGNVTIKKYIAFLISPLLQRLALQKAFLITLIVLIILAVISINAVFGADGIIESARKSEIMNNFSTFKEQINTFNAEKELESEDYSVESLTAGRNTLIYNTQGEDTTGNIQTVIPSMDDNYAEKFEIIKGELLLYASSQLEYDIAVGVGIKVSPYIIVDGVLLSANQNLALQSTDGVVTLPERVTEIGAGAFSGVEGLKEIIIPGTVKVIQQDAFSYNADIEKVTIMNGVEIIGNSAFAYCRNLKEITMPDSVVSMGQSVFGNCTSLTIVKLSNNITRLEAGVFQNCPITSLVLPANLEYIEQNAFIGADINTMEIPANVTYIASGAFKGCGNLYNLTINEANPNFVIEEGILYSLDGNTLNLLPAGNKSTITIREGTKRIENEGALLIATNCVTLNLPSTLEYLFGMSMPQNVTPKLTTINIPDSNPYLMVEDGYVYSKDGKTLYYVIASKKNIEINEKVETIAAGAFFACSYLTELEIPDNVVTIEDYALTACPYLEKIEIGSGTSNLKSGFKTTLYEITDLEIIIDDENPYYKTENNLILTKDGKEVITYISKKSTDIVVPEGVEKLNAQAFKKSDITGIHLPSTLKEIGNECFRECFYITEIDIPNSVQTIADTAFDGCGYITEIRIDKSRGSISGSPWSVPKGESCYKYQQFLQKIFLNYLQKKYVMV